MLVPHTKFDAEGRSALTHYGSIANTAVPPESSGLPKSRGEYCHSRSYPSVPITWPDGFVPVVEVGHMHVTMNKTH